MLDLIDKSLDLIEILGFISIFLGCILLILASVGILRMPDTLTRMHAGTKASTLGTILIVIGVICLEPSLWFKLILIVLFVLLTNPLSTSILAKSSYETDGFLNISGIDDMKDID